MANRNFGLVNNASVQALYDDSIAIVDPTGVDDTFRISFVNAGNSGQGPRTIQSAGGENFNGFDPIAGQVDSLILANDGDSLTLGWDSRSSMWQVIIKSIWVAPGMQNPMGTQGDLIAGDVDGVPIALPLGTPGQVLTVSPAGYGVYTPQWATPAAPGMSNPMTTAGDMIMATTGGVPIRMGIGTNGQVLTMAAGLPAWTAATAAPMPTSLLTDFANNVSTTTGLTFGYQGGTIRTDKVTTLVTAGAVVMTANTTNYVEATTAGVVSSNTSGFTSGRFPIAIVITNASAITGITDKRGVLYVFTGGTLASALNEAPMITLASASTVSIGGAAANSITISGTVAITAFDGVAAGIFRRVVFSGALVLTYNAGAFILPGAANITTAAGDVAEFLSLGSGQWKCMSYSRASGAALVGALTNFAGSVNSAAPNATVPVVSLTASNAATNVDAVFASKGSGAILSQVPDNTVAGGNKRGGNAVDWQMTRGANTQVASANYSVVAGGLNNTASGSGYAVVSGGTSNTASGYSSTVAGGLGGTASGDYSATAGGNNATASGKFSFVGGGSNNTASGDYSSVPGGSSASTRGIYGMQAYGSGLNAIAGDAQSGKYVLRAKTTDATVTTMTTDGAVASAINGVILPTFSAYSVKGRVVSICQATGDVSDWDIRCTVKQGANAAATALVGTATVTMVNQTAGASTWVLALTVDTTNGGLKFAITGVAATIIKWVATIETVEVLG